MDQVLPLGSFLKWVPFMMQVPMVPGWVATGLGLSFNHMEFTEKPMGKAQILDDASVSVHAFTLSAQLFMEVCSLISFVDRACSFSHLLFAGSLEQIRGKSGLLCMSPLQTFTYL